MIFCIKLKHSAHKQEQGDTQFVSFLKQIVCPLVPAYCFFILGLAINDAKYPKNIAAAMPPADAFTPPINAPIRPEFCASVIAPLAKLAPKPRSGTVAPQPAKSITY